MSHYDEKYVEQLRSTLRKAVERIDKLESQLSRVKADTIERCAKVADDHCITADNDVEEAICQKAIDIAAAIRALAKEHSNERTEKPATTNIRP